MMHKHTHSSSLFYLTLLHIPKKKAPFLCFSWARVKLDFAFPKCTVDKNVRIFKAFRTIMIVLPLSYIILIFNNLLILPWELK